ncbi:MAG: tetratricopeptide repeat protein [Kiritimatiellae bacterium]|nr:tetratricopeptide repeat protein [Kiritimatiellia bacterium]
MSTRSRRSFAAWLLAALLALSLAVADGRAQVPECLQAAASLIKARQYAPAVQELDRLLTERADDILLLRLKGVCLMELGQSDEAAAVLKRAVALAPENVACRFYLAQALAYRGSVAEALRELGKVREMAPDSPYAERAATVIPKLHQLALSAQPMPAKRRWNVAARIAGEYDDNVPARSKHDEDGGSTDAWRALLSLYLEYRLLDQKIEKTPFTLGAAYSVYANWHEDDLYTDYDLVVHSGTVFVRKSGRRLLPYNLEIAGSYSDVQLGTEPYSETAEARGELSIQWADWAVAAPRYSMSWKGFEDDTVQPDLYSRDGLDQTIGIDQYFYLFDNRLILGLGYGYRTARTEGGTFDIDSHNGQMSASVALPLNLRIRTRVEYADEDYIEYTPDPRRTDDSWTVSTSLSRAVCGDWLRAELNHTYVTSQSTLAFAEFDRNVYGASLRGSF